MGATAAAITSTGGNLLSTFGLSNIGAAQEGAANENQQNAVNAANSPQQLQQLEQANQANQQDLQNKQAIINSVSPSLLALGRQTLDMLNGKGNSPMLAGYDTSTAQARTDLENRLKAQYGAGYADTTAGQQALSNFDIQNANNRQGLNYQTAMSNLAMLNPYVANGTAQNVNNMLNIGTGYGSNASRVSGAYQNTGNQRIATAGSQYLPMVGIGNTMSGSGGTLSSIFGGSGGDTPGMAGGAAKVGQSLQMFA